MRRHLLYPKPVENLLSRTRALPAEERAHLWRVYRAVRKAVRRKTLVGEGAALVEELIGAAGARPEGYLTVTLALKLAQAYSIQALAHAGAQERAYRAVASEALRLLRLELREALGLRQRLPSVSWTTGEPPETPVWLAVADGSFKGNRSGVGFQLFDPSYQLRAEVGLVVSASDPVFAELQASVLALNTLHALGARHARVLVDAQSVVHALKSGLPSRYTTAETALKSSVSAFEFLDVVQVPRTVTHAADRLAANWSSHYP